MGVTLIVANLTVYMSIVLRCLGEENDADNKVANVKHIHSVNTRKRNRKADPLRTLETAFDSTAVDSLNTMDATTKHYVGLDPTTTTTNIVFASGHPQIRSESDALELDNFSGPDDSSIAKAHYVV